MAKKTKKLNDSEIIRKQQIEIAVLRERISRMDKALSKTSRSVLVKDVEETKANVKKEHKFNVKAWLATSCFAIGSLLVGIANMIIHFVDKH